MLTFAIWGIGLAVLIVMAVGNAAIIAVAYRKHWILGFLSLAVSMILWPVLLGQMQ